MNTTSNYEVILSEYLRLKGSDAALHESVAETAMFLEDLFGIYLSDEDICLRRLGSAQAIRALVEERLARTVT